MSSYKNVNSDYTLTCNNGNGLFTVNAITDFNELTTFNALVVFNGGTANDVPAGNGSAFYTAALGNPGNGFTAGGVLFQKTSNANSYAGLRFDTTANTWQISTSVSASGLPIDAYANIATGIVPSVAGANTQVQFNDSNALGATANLTFDKATSILTINGPQVLGNTATPSNPTNAVAMYSNAVGGGGTGLYVQSTTVSDELVSKSKAIVYSIIF